MSTVNVTTNNNTVNVVDNKETISVIGRVGIENPITITQPVTNVVQITAAGPIGPAGPQGPQGPVGSIFPYTGSAGISGSLIVTGSISATSITSSLRGTSSYTNQALSSSYAITASYALSANINTSNFATLGSNTFGGAQTINSDLKVSEGSRIYVDGGNSIPSPGISSYSDPTTQLTDQGQYSGETIKGVAGENLELGQLIYLYTDGSWYKAVASGSQEAATSLLGILVGSMPATPTENITVLLRGNTYTNKSLGSEASGIPMWISVTAGSIRDSAPTTQGQFVRQVGYMLAYHVVRFNPDNYYSIVP
jgi:hypothetical protein